MKRNAAYKPPFVWFGGKSPVADLVWDALGDVDNYVEPFFGSGAVLFLRPTPGGIETVNDADGLLANFWRALQRDHEAVAEHADWPVTECDLHARHLWLLGQRERITDRLMGDPDFFDAKAAGWWVWGLNCWIGSGWCSGNGPWVCENGIITLRNTGKGVNRQLPHLGNTGQGVNRQLPHLGDTGKGTERREWLTGYLRDFSDRLRDVRVCCGDWSRVCGPSVTFKHGLTGVFLDPPYGEGANRTNGIYAKDCEKVSTDVRLWAIEQGGNPEMRIVLAGYEGEHSMPKDWREFGWEAVGGYGLEGDGCGRKNKCRERLWFSPHCIAEKQMNLFGT
jgi:hypothetical protein